MPQNVFCNLKDDTLPVTELSNPSLEPFIIEPSFAPSIEPFSSPLIENLSNLDISDNALLQIAEEYAKSTVNEVHPLSNTLDVTEINQAIKDLWAQIDILYDFIKPQTIEIHNFNCLKVNSSVTTVKEKVNALFFDALIPLNWKISVTWIDNPDTNDVDNVTVVMINYHVKEKTVKKLTQYFEKYYNNGVYIQ